MVKWLSVPTHHNVRDVCWNPARFAVKTICIGEKSTRKTPHENPLHQESPDSTSGFCRTRNRVCYVAQQNDNQTGKDFSTC